MQPMTFDFIADPGHGWLRVAPDQALALGVTTHDLTSCSYVCRHTMALYAEEDCDLAVILAAHHKATGQMPTIRETHTNMDSPIRNLPRCTGRYAAWKEAHAYLAGLKADA
jgi:hypothetical protein